MFASQTHSKTIIECITEPNIAVYWDYFFECEIRTWLKWHDYWLEKAQSSAVPIYFFRFEDLLLQPEYTLKQMFKFLLGTENIDGTVIDERIKETIKSGKNFLYKPR